MSDDTEIRCTCDEMDPCGPCCPACIPTPEQIRANRREKARNHREFLRKVDVAVKIAEAHGMDVGEVRIIYEVCERTMRIVCLPRGEEE